MHRDEVRIFRGSADDHFRRLTLFVRDVRTMVPLDDEPPTEVSSSSGWLEYASPNACKPAKSRFDSLLKEFTDPFVISMLLVISILFAMVVTQDMNAIVQYSAAMLVCPALWVGFRCVSMLRDREPRSGPKPKDPFAIPHRKNAAEWLMWLMLLPLVPIAWLIDRWSRRR